MKIIANYKDEKNKNKLLIFQDNMLADFNQLLEELSESNYKKSALITYWLNDYKNYLCNEDSFSSDKLIKYKRGAIIKVNLGFNLGNEQGDCIIVLF